MKTVANVSTHSERTISISILEFEIKDENGPDLESH